MESVLFEPEGEKVAGRNGQTWRMYLANQVMEPQQGITSSVFILILKKKQ